MSRTTIAIAVLALSLGGGAIISFAVLRPSPHSTDWFAAHATERAAQLAHCQQYPHSDPANCDAAFLAEWRTQGAAYAAAARAFK